jgi:acetyl esterase/lipase
VHRTDFTEPRTDPARLHRLRQLLAERVAGPEIPLATRRAEFEAVMTRTPPVEGVSVADVDAGGTPGLEIAPDGVTPVAAILYLHGGGYGLGSARTVLPMASRIALAARAVVVSLDYGLAPEHPFPRARDQVLAAHSWLAARHPALPVFLGGDSAGGGLTVSALLSLRDAGTPVAGGFGISPWSDLTLAGASLDANAGTDPQVARWMLEEFSVNYVGADGDRADPGVSPALADLTGIAPLLVQVSRAEALYDDGCRLAEAAAKAGVDVTLQTWPDVPHVWHGFAPKLLEADAAIAEIGRWIDSHRTPER